MNILFLCTINIKMKQNLVTRSRHVEIVTKSKFKCLLTSGSFAVNYPHGLSVLFAGTSDRKSVQTPRPPEPEVAKIWNFLTGVKQTANTDKEMSQSTR
jgi:hypothetical protein